MKLKLPINILDIFRNKKQINENVMSDELVMDTNAVVKYVITRTELPIDVVLKVLDAENDWLHENGFYDQDED